ncbi:MAG TPA: EAL domain-containing protein [Paraburkholderia sp.]|uniref:putative bifunctional diguanylate cyclase/phosphodiesterase n=1 Tax=Paraburkholderia sp. TaxID=1926495 RepID=UPI002B49A0ED|nr:EAL domain-containing protein [Paraburkholderia sp.]HKR38302.1 EAL domain-containing protein [Paraburkholderia sp.]
MMRESSEPAPPRIAIKLGIEEPARSAPGETEQLANHRAEWEGILGERFAAMAELEQIAHFGSWSFDLLARHPSFSEEALRLLGLVCSPPGQAPPDYRSHLHADDRPRITEMVQATFVTGKSIDAQLRVLREDGGIRWLRVIGRRDAGAPHRVLGVLCDITPLKRIQMQQRVELEAARLLAGTSALAPVVGKIIRIVCQTLGWEWGAYWSLDETSNQMRLLKGWSVERDAYRKFEKASEHTSFALGVGLIGEVFCNGKPRWISDIRKNQTLLRRHWAINAGLRGGFAFPVKADGRVVGVLEFFSRFARQPDASLPAISRTLAAQIGQFIGRKLVEERIRHLASHDHLSGLLNRTAFNERLRQAIAKAQRSKGRVAVLFIDLDGFKRINDTLGHDAGDALLQQFSQRLRNCFRETDAVGRLGGDEFAVLVQNPGSTPKVLARFARKVLRRTGEPFRVQGREYRLGASIGVGIYPEDGDDAATLLRSADIAMYGVKWHGENSFQFCATRTDAHPHDQLAMEASLARALEQDELSLAFQPIYQLASRRITGFEALMRWSHPELGDVSPGRFIPLAEETGLIRLLGLFALRQACEQAVHWPIPLTVAVNVSARQLVDARFPQQVSEILNATGLAAERLRLEITESTLMHQNAVYLLEQIRALGVGLSIDDFGTGYSSLAYLKRLPVDTVKLDQTFVRGLPDDANDAAIAGAVIALGRNLKLAVVAEGVERDEQCEYLRKLGCDAVQGYLISRPMPANEVSEWLSRAEAACSE